MKQNLNVQQSNDQRGATMVEFAFAIGFFLFLLGGIADLGVSMHRKTMLTHLGNEIARLISLRLASASTAQCDSVNISDNIIINTINTKGQAMAHDSLGIDVTSWQVLWRSPAGAQTNPSFNLSLTSRIPCFFLCHISPTGWTARASVESMVANQGLTCDNVLL